MERHKERHAEERGKPEPLASPPSVFVLGGNGTTLAFTTSLRAQERLISVCLVPLAWVPMGVVLGDLRQQVTIPADNVPGWLDQTFTPDDPHAFIAPMRDIELLLRTTWHAQAPQSLSREILVNPEDLPEEVLDALTRPQTKLTQCAVCRRSCVRDDFIWNDRQLCAWDYHATVFGRRGPWRNEPYEERLFETLARAAYVVAPLLDEINVDSVLALNAFPEPALRLLINTAIAQAPGASYLAVRTQGGLMLLREREPSTS